MNAKTLAMIVAAGILIAACRTAPVTSTTPANTGGNVPGPSGPGDGPSVQTGGIDLGGQSEFIGFEGEEPGDADIIRGDLVIYFEFDSSEIQPRFTEMLAAHARYLSAVRSVSIRLEGHADERGTREYNIGLGERRAQAVRQILMLQNVASVQIDTVSFGEERPVATGSDEQSYSQNRRVELVYR